MKAILSSLLIFASFPVEAETIYKSMDAKGQVVYSDEPIHGARVVERFEGAAETGPRGPAPANEIARAERELEKAERALQLGRGPLPHERKGLAEGGTRLTDDYFQRVLALERAVEKAFLRLEQARAAP